MYRIMKFEVLCGLPGAGKTTYADRRKAEDSNVMVFNADIYAEDSSSVKGLIKHLKELQVENENTICVIDGLFLTKGTQQLFQYDLYDPLYVYFNEDKEKCLINDAHRIRNNERIQNSTTTIKKGQLYNPKNFTKNVLMLETKTPYFDDAVLDSLKNNPWADSSGNVRSSTWTLEGSTYGTCWDEDGPSEPTWGDEEALPKEDFYQFIDFISEITLEEDKTVIINKYGHLLEEDSDSEGDYYGGVEYQGFWTFNPKRIIKEILQNDFDVYNNETQIIKEQYPEVYLRFLL